LGFFGCQTEKGKKKKKEKGRIMLLGFWGREKVIMGHQHEAPWPKVGLI
jgi:hypothetical protein